MSIYSRLDRIAADVEKLNRQVKSVSNAPQSQRTSVEGGSIDFNDTDGNLQAIFGGQDDGSTTVRHVDGPVPPIPSGLTAHVDGPIVQVSWDGTFEDGVSATFDWSHLEVVAVGPSNEQLRGTISDVTGASTSLAATVSGEWTVVARSVSRAEKRSLDGDAGTVDVELVGLTGAINDAIGSANGKNTVTYSETPPTPADEGIAGDTWWVGQVGRPNDIIEATNLLSNPSFENGVGQVGVPSGNSSGATAVTDTFWHGTGTRSVKVTPGTANSSAFYPVSAGGSLSPLMQVGKTYTFSALIHLETAQSGAIFQRARKLTIGIRDSAGVANYDFATSEQAPNVPGTYRLSVTATIPLSAQYAWLMMANGSSTTPVWFDDAVLEEGTGSGAYFDGDTESGVSDNESHYRWLGTPHASMSEKYLPAIPASGSDVWNITEQYQFTSSGWLPVELNHEVISSVDLGKATVGELDGIRITGKSVRGQQLSGDAIDGKVVTGGTYRTSDGTGEWSDGGLFIARPDGTSMVRFPTDGSPLSLTASDTQIERASVGELDMVNGAVRSGGTFSLAAGVTAPPSPPELTTGWQKVCTLEKPDTSLAYDWLGLALWENPSGKSWVRAVNVLGAEGDTRDVIECYDYDTGVFEQAFRLDINPRAGVTVIGDVAYVVGPDYLQSNIGKQWVHGFDLNTGVRVSRWEFTRFPGGAGGRFAIGNDGTNVVVAGITPARTLYVLRYNPATGVQVGSDWTTPTGDWVGGQDLQGVHVSGSEVTILPKQTARVYTASGNTLTRKTDSANANGFAGWDNPNKNGAGYVFASFAHHVVDGAGNVYSGALSLPSDYTLQACFTWSDGTHESDPSPVATLQGGARSSYTLSMPERSGLQRIVYVRPGASGLWWRAELPGGTAIGPLGVIGTLNATPPTTNTFPASTPAVLKSSIGGFQVRGDGSGSWGPLTFNSDGTMTQAAPAWTAITSFAAGFSAHTFGYAPAYRIWPDGKVEWRGVIGGTFNATGGVDPFTLPPATRPAQSVNFQIATQGNAGGRAEFGPTGATTVLRIYTSSSRPFAMLDGCYYYTT